MVEPSIAASESEIEACYPVMRELRPHVSKDGFASRVTAQRKQGYQLAYIAEDGRPVSVAGFRLGENLAWGRFLYVDDLVTAADCRSKGYGRAMLAWLREYAKSQGCDELHLDSGVQRTDAHRFYKREGMILSSYHFKVKLRED